MTKTRSTAPTVVPPLAGRVAAVAVALVAALAPRPAAAQTGGDVGVTIAPAFLHYLDVDPVCCPASVWGAVGAGQWRPPSRWGPHPPAPVAAELKRPPQTARRWSRRPSRGGPD